MRRLLMAMSLLVLAACGGGESTTGAPGAAAPTLRTAMSAGEPSRQQATAGTVRSPADQLFDFAEGKYPDIFPGHKATATSTPYAYRYYPETGVYLAVVVDGSSGLFPNRIYVMGGPFGARPVYAGSVTQFITLVPWYAVKFNTAAVSVEGYQGETAPLTVRATLTPQHGAGAVYPKLVDDAATFAPNPPTSYNGYSELSAQLYVDKSTPGVHSGQIALRLCKDLPCTAEYEGSPALLPYTVKLLPAKNLTPLTPLAGAADWAMHQGNAGHTGHVPVTLDASKFNRRWRWVSPATGYNTNLSPAVTHAGKLYMSRGGYHVPADLFALNESDGAVAWSFSFGTVPAVNPPAVAGGRLFLATSGHEDTFMWSFMTANGDQASKAPFYSQWSRYMAPTIDNTSVYTNGGYYGGLLSFKRSDGSQNWFNSGLPQYDGWTPAVDATHAYGFMDKSLYAINKATGATAFSITDPSAGWGGYSVGGAPILGSSGRVLIKHGTSGTNSIVAFDTAKRSIAWSVPGRFALTPALANGTIYVANGSQLEARREADGSLIWSWTPPEATSPFQGVQSNIVATNNLVFVCTSSTLYAIDIATRKAVWSFAVSGELALSAQGVLYVVIPGRSDYSTTVPSSVVAFNLR